MFQQIVLSIFPPCAIHHQCVSIDCPHHPCHRTGMFRRSFQSRILKGRMIHRSFRQCLMFGRMFRHSLCGRPISNQIFPLLIYLPPFSAPLLRRSHHLRLVCAITCLSSLILMALNAIELLPSSLLRTIRIPLQPSITPRFSTTTQPQ